MKTFNFNKKECLTLKSSEFSSTDPLQQLKKKQNQNQKLKALQKTLEITFN